MAWVQDQINTLRHCNKLEFLLLQNFNKNKIFMNVPKKSYQWKNNKTHVFFLSFLRSFKGIFVYKSCYRLESKIGSEKKNVDDKL